MYFLGCVEGSHSMVMTRRECAYGRPGFWDQMGIYSPSEIKQWRINVWFYILFWLKVIHTLPSNKQSGLSAWSATYVHERRPSSNSIFFFPILILKYPAYSSPSQHAAAAAALQHVQLMLLLPGTSSVAAPHCNSRPIKNHSPRFNRSDLGHSLSLNPEP